jgi:hypothetical protein
MSAASAAAPRHPASPPVWIVSPPPPRPRGMHTVTHRVARPAALSRGGGWVSASVPGARWTRIRAVGLVRVQLGTRPGPGLVPPRVARSWACWLRGLAASAVARLRRRGDRPAAVSGGGCVLRLRHDRPAGPGGGRFREGGSRAGPSGGRDPLASGPARPIHPSRRGLYDRRREPAPAPRRRCGGVRAGAGRERGGGRLPGGAVRADGKPP